MADLREPQEIMSFLEIEYEKLKSCENRIKFCALNSILNTFKCLNEKQPSFSFSKLEAELSIDANEDLVIAAQKSSESCCEIIIDIFNLFITNSIFDTSLDNHLPHFICQFVYNNDVKCSEEIRCQAIKLLRLYLKNRKLSKLETNLDNIFTIIKQSIEDPYPEVVKEICACFIDMDVEFLRTLLSVHLNSMVEIITKPLLHQHYKVRISCLNSIDHVAILADVSFFESVFSYLTQTLLDQVPQVRLCITRIVGNWMIKLYSRQYLWERLISLFLTSLSDDVPEIRCLAFELWREAGKSYELEHEEELKKECMNISSSLCTLIELDYDNLPIGCQIIAGNNLGKLLPAIKNDLKDWKNSVQLKASQLLYQLIVNAKERISPHILKLIDIFIDGSKIIEMDAYNMIMKSIQLTGYFVEANIWCSIIVELVEDNPSLSNLRVLEKLLSGVQVIDQSTESSIINMLVEPNVCQVDNVAMKEAILFCIQVLLNHAHLDEKEGFNYFLVLATIHGTTEPIRDDCNLLLTKLADTLGMKSKISLWNIYSRKLIEELEAFTLCDMWTADSLEWKIFNSLLNEADLSHYVIEAEKVLKIVSMPAKDSVMRFNCLKAISYFFESEDQVNSVPQSFLIFCIKDIIFPNLIWRAGRSAATVRASAVTSLYILLKNCNIESSNKILLKDVTTGVVNCIEDDNWTTRHFVCRTLQFLLDNLSMNFDEKYFLLIINALINRMDDVDQEIRILSCQTVGKYLIKFLENGLHEIQRMCFNNAIDKLFVYLCDSDEKLQNETLDVLKNLCKYDEKLMRSHFIDLNGKISTAFVEQLFERSH